VVGQLIDSVRKRFIAGFFPVQKRKGDDEEEGRMEVDMLAFVGGEYFINDNFTFT
jgi:hypothetical protein